jgi:hypothetical protein
VNPSRVSSWLLRSRHKIGLPGSHQGAIDAASQTQPSGVSPRQYVFHDDEAGVGPLFNDLIFTCAKLRVRARPLRVSPRRRRGIYLSFRAKQTTRP